MNPGTSPTLVASGSVARRLRSAKRQHTFRRTATAYLFLLPNLVAFILFLLLPVLWVIRQSFLEGGVTEPARWIGLTNWDRALGDPAVANSLRNTLAFTGMYVPTLLLLAMMAALFLARVRRGATLLRSMIYLPSLAPIVVAAIVWLFLVNPEVGLLNFANRELGLAPINFLGDTNLALPTLVAIEVWRGIGFWALFFVAALMAVPRDLYHAAELDRASPLRRFWHVTLPGIRAPMLVAVILAVLVGMQVFDSVYALTGGAPAGATDTAVFYIYQNTFAFGQVGYGAVLSIILLLATVLLTLVLLRVLRFRSPASRGQSGLHRILREARSLRGSLRTGRVGRYLTSASRRIAVVAVTASRPGSGASAVTSAQPPVRTSSRFRRPRRRGRATAYCGLATFSLIAIVPFFYVISASLKDSKQLFQYPPQWLPDPFYVDNYVDLVLEHSLLRWIANTLLVALTVTVIKVVCDSMAAYAFAKMHFGGRKLIYSLMLATVMIPAGVLVIPLFFLARDAGILNSYWALMLPPLANPIGIFIMRGYIQGLPNDLERAARIDGCQSWRIYWRVILPLVRPGLVVVAILTFLTQYLSFIWPLVATSSEDMYVLTVGLAKLRPYIDVDWGLISAAAVVTLMPLVAVFLLLQRYFVQASLAGALKE